MKQWADAQKYQYSKSAGWIVSLPRQQNKAGVADNLFSSSSGASRWKILRVLVHRGGSGLWICLFVELKLIPRFARSYFKAIELGYFTEDPAAYHDPNVCAPYTNTTQTG